MPMTNSQAGQQSGNPKTQEGTVKNGVVVLPPQAKLPDGAEVTPLEGRADDPPFLRAILDLAKPRDWPEDFALNHAHYVKGHPKKA
jgi:hypothetical protein